MKRLLTAKELESSARAALADSHSQRINCGGNLFLFVGAGSCTWAARIKLPNHDTFQKIGKYPGMTMKAAREAVLSAIQAKQAENSLKPAKPKFQDYSRRWLETLLPDPDSARTHKNDKRYRNIKSLIKNLEKLGPLQLDEITPKKVDSVLSKANCSRGSKYRTIQALNQMMNSAVADGYITSNPCRVMVTSTGTISAKYPKPKTIGFAWVEAEQLGAKFFEPLASQPTINKVFYLLDAFTALRLTSCISIEWDWIKSDRIMVPGKFMKMGRPFDVPVTPYIAALLSNWKGACEGLELVSKFVFPSRSDPSRSKRLQDVQVPVTDLTHGEMTIHGLRKSFRTWAAEYMISNDVAEKALAHAPKNQLMATYNKYDYFRERQEALCLWNEYLCRMLPEEYLSLIEGMDPAQRARFGTVLEEREKAFAASSRAD